MEAIQIQPNSVPVENYSDSFFQNTPLDLRFESSKYLPFYPVSSINEGSQINFFMPKWSSRVVWDLAESLFAVKAKIKTAAGKTPKNNSVVTPINDILYSMFSDMKTYLNNVCVTPNSMNFGFKKYLENTLSYDGGAKAGILQAAGYYEDSAFQFNDIPSNAGALARLERFCNVAQKQDRSITTKDWNADGIWFVGKLGTDIDHHIINGIDVRLEYTPQSPEFFLLTQEAEKYKFEIDKMVVYGLARTLQAPIYQKIEQKLKTHDMHLPFKRREVVPYTIPANNANFISDQLFAGSTVTPSRVILAITTEQAYMGDYQQNPYNFRHSWGDVKIEQVKLTLNGESIDGLILDDSKEMDYLKLLMYLGMADGYNNNLSMDKYSGGYYFVIFDLTTSGTSSLALQNPAVRTGHARCNIVFNQGPEETLELLVYSEYPSKLTIKETAQGRVVSTNYLD